MKSAKVRNILMAGMLLAAFATGCKKTPKNITNIPGMQARPGSETDLNRPINPFPPGMDPNARGIREISEPIADAQRDEATLAPQTIYFDFDRSAIKPSEQGKLDAVATFIKSTQGVQILIEGHCDERGTEEYNRSLGERRAIAAREYLLQKHGISSERVTTSSLGEDRPASLEKTEEGYAKNRRDQFVVLRPR